jgi:hypothetical protein
LLASSEGTRTAASADSDEQLYTYALELLKVLVAAAPLPVVCNNPSCANLDGGSEAAAVHKACSVRKCRYCCAACQKADWKRHMCACQVMAAAGRTCV